MDTTNKKSRSDLTAYFKKNSIPTEQNFADFIGATLNQRDDGIYKPPGDPLCVEAAKKPQLPLFNFYEKFTDANPSWFIGLGDGKLDANDSPDQGFVRGFAVGNPAISSTEPATTRFFIALATGNVGIGTVAPDHRLHVAGSFQAESADIVGAFNAKSTATIDGVLNAKSSATLDGAFHAKSTATLDGAMLAKSTATITDALTAQSIATVIGAFNAKSTATIDGALNANASATILGALNAKSTATIDGAFNAKSVATIDGAFNAQSTATIADVLTANKDVIVKGAMKADSNATIKGALSAESTATIADVLTANKDVIAKGALKADSTATIKGALSAESTATIADVLTANKEAVVKGAFNAQSTATIAGILNAQSTATIADVLTANKDVIVKGVMKAETTATIKGALSTEASATIGGVLTANKLVTANEGLTVASGKTTVQDLQANAAVIATKGLTVTGTTTLQEFRIDNKPRASVDLDVNSDGLKLTGTAVKINGNLEVTGQWTLAGVPIKKIVQEVTPDAEDATSIPTEAAVKNYVTHSITTAKPPTTSSITADTKDQLATAEAVKNYVTNSITTARPPTTNSITADTKDQLTTAEAVKTFVNTAIPIGAILMWSGSEVEIPTGWALCNGTLHQASGRTPPDLRGRFILAAGKNQDDSLAPTYAAKEKGGAREVRLTSEQMPSHKHDVTVALGSPSYSSVYLDGDDNAHMAATGKDNDGAEIVLTNNSSLNDRNLSFSHSHTATVTEQDKGGGVAHNNMPPYFVLAFIMRVS